MDTMNIVLEKLFETNTVDDGEARLPLHSHMDREEGVLIDRVFRTVNPDISIEIGFAYGVSTLFACDALAANGKAARHIIIDPFQHSAWRGIGLKNIARAGYEHFIDFHEERSEVALPGLAAGGTRAQVAIIDGNHTFDHALVDFFFVNKMVTVGGVVILDDTNWPAISRLVEHILTYPAYELFATKPRLERVSARTKLRRALERITRLPGPRRPPWEYPTCMAFRKIAEDTRQWDWHADF
jgi:predicted O-methyltransferase YrrM